MGLQGTLNDVSSDSIPLLLLSLILKTVANLRYSLITLLRTVGLSGQYTSGDIDDGFVTSIGSGLAGLVLLAEQLNKNRVLSYKHNGLVGVGGGENCVVCLSMIRDGDMVRRLDCRHVFHRDCFDGWIDRFKFNCPLCRSPLVSDECVDITRRRVGCDLVDWFSPM